jgi:hypothetical protein
VYRRNAANSAWILEGGVDSLINAANVSEVLTGTDATKAVTPDALAGLWQRGTDLASASTLSLPATGGGVFTVTGTTTVTGISTGSGGRRVSLRFAGALTLTHSANLILPGAVNITTAAGDVADFINDAVQDATGSNWRCVNYQRASGVATLGIVIPGISATGNYSATSANAGGYIYFQALGAAATLSLPAASTMAGQTITVINSSTDYPVIIDPNGAETLDGATTRQTFGMSRVTIFSNGGAWLTVQGSYLYYSGDQTLPAAGSSVGVFPHGLGVRPTKFWCELRCTAADIGYSIGDIVPIPVLDSNASGIVYFRVVIDATNVDVRFTTGTFGLPNKGTGASAAATASSWRGRFYAEAY